MTNSACDLMKMAVISAATLIFFGSLATLAAKVWGLESTFPIFLGYAGFLLVFAGIVGIIATALTMMVPKVSHKLDLCQH
jgi:hypothetical protein